MNEKELRENIIYLVNKYIKDGFIREKLVSEINKDVDSVKYILAEIDKLKKCPYNNYDLEIIKDIVFYYV